MMPITLYPMGEIMASQTETTEAAVQVANDHRLKQSGCLDTWYQGRLLAGQPHRRLGKEYVLRRNALNEAYEQQVEPLRQQFRESMSGRVLPPFLVPGFQALTLGKPDTKKQRSALTSKRREPLTYMQRVLILGSPIILMVVFGVVSNVVSDLRSAPTTKPAVSLSSCESAMHTASREPDSALAEPLIMATTQACRSKAAWIAAVKQFPGAMGMMDFSDAQARQSWELVCYEVPSAPACRG